MHHSVDCSDRNPIGVRQEPTRPTRVEKLRRRRSKTENVPVGIDPDDLSVLLRCGLALRNFGDPPMRRVDGLGVGKKSTNVFWPFQLDDVQVINEHPDENLRNNFQGAQPPFPRNRSSLQTLHRWKNPST